jgi:putative Mg2+ transporter-C (MgtC) family protein
MNELMLVKQIFFSFILGALIGLEREYHENSAGIRTYAAIAVGACLFGILSTHVASSAFYNNFFANAKEYKSVVDPSRIAAQIVSGVGFIGGGVIFKSGKFTKGLTTAATIWVTAAIGLSVAFELFYVPIATTILVIFILWLNHFKFWIKLKKRHEYKRSNDLE